MIKNKQVSAFFLGIFLSAAFPSSLFAQQAAAVSDVAAPVADVIDVHAKISLDFKDAEIGTVLRVISLKSGINIVAGPEVVGAVTIRLEDVEWQKALDVILRTYNYVYEKDGNVIRVTTRDKMQLEPVDTKTFILNYSKATEVQLAVQDILTERGRVKIAERMNMLIVTDIPSNIFQIGKVIESVDKITPQAYIDSKIIRTQQGVTKNLGIDWNVAGGIANGSTRPTTFPFTTNGGGENLPAPIAQFLPIGAPADVTLTSPSNPRDFPRPGVVDPANAEFSFGTMSFSTFRSVLNLIESNSASKVVSNPRIVVLNNQTAKVQVGDQIPIPSFERNENTGSMEVSGFVYRDTGVVLNVTPHINDANEIIVDLKPEVSSVSTTPQDFGDFLAPRFSTTAANTQVMIKSGQTIAIGGLLTDNDSESINKVPYFSDIPVIGKILFKNQSKTADGNTDAETIFFVTVTSVDASGQPVKDRAKQDDLSSQDSASSTDSKSSVPANSTSAA